MPASTRNATRIDKSPDRTQTPVELDRSNDELAVPVVVIELSSPDAAAKSASPLASLEIQ